MYDPTFSSRGMSLFGFLGKVKLLELTHKVYIEQISLGNIKVLLNICLIDTQNIVVLGKTVSVFTVAYYVYSI